MNESSKMSKAIISIVAGLALGTLPMFLSQVPSESSWFRNVEETSRILLIPGVAAAYVLSLGRIHDASLAVIVGGSCCFYSGLFYFLATRWKAKS